MMKKYKLTKLEQETVILFNREEKNAEVYTHEPKIIKKLDILCENSDGVFLKTDDNGYGGFTYELPKTLINIRKPREKKQLTEEQKQTFKKQLKKGSTNNLTN